MEKPEDCAQEEGLPGRFMDEGKDEKNAVRHRREVGVVPLLEGLTNQR
jgi:hypothetical protein